MLRCFGRPDDGARVDGRWHVYNCTELQNVNHLAGNCHAINVLGLWTAIEDGEHAHKATGDNWLVDKTYFNAKPMKVLRVEEAIPAGKVSECASTRFACKQSDEKFYIFMLHGILVMLLKFRYYNAKYINWITYYRCY